MFLQPGLKTEYSKVRMMAHWVKNLLYIYKILDLKPPQSTCGSLLWCCAYDLKVGSGGRQNPVAHGPTSLPKMMNYRVQLCLET